MDDWCQDTEMRMLIAVKEYPLRRTALHDVTTESKCESFFALDNETIFSFITYTVSHISIHNLMLISC